MKISLRLRPSATHLQRAASSRRSYTLRERYYCANECATPRQSSPAQRWLPTAAWRRFCSLRAQHARYHACDSQTEVQGVRCRNQAGFQRVRIGQKFSSRNNCEWFSSRCESICSLVNRKDISWTVSDEKEHFVDSR